MKLRFTPRAINNINDIAIYLEARNPVAMRKVRAAIYAALENLLLFPSAGRLQNVGEIRKLVTRHYGYLIYYAVDEAADEVVVLNIKHGAQDRDLADR